MKNKVMKSYTDLEQSKKLAEILPLESADMWWSRCTITDFGDGVLKVSYAVEPCNISQFRNTREDVPCWSLAALFSLIKDKCGYFELVYLKRTSDGRANPLEDVYRLSTDVYDVYEKEEVDACVAMIEKLGNEELL